MRDPVLHQVSTSPLTDTQIKDYFYCWKLVCQDHHCSQLLQFKIVRSITVVVWFTKLQIQRHQREKQVTHVFDHSFNTPSHTLLSFFFMEQCLLNCKLHRRLRLRPKRGRSWVPILVLNALHNIVITGLSWPYFSTYWPKHLKPQAWGGVGGGARNILSDKEGPYSFPARVLVRHNISFGRGHGWLDVHHH